MSEDWDEFSDDEEEGEEDEEEEFTDIFFFGAVGLDLWGIW